MTIPREVFELPSLHLTTVHDAPVVSLGVPGTVTRGSDPVLWLVDGAVRAPRRLTRLLRADALLGLRLDPPTRPVRLRITLVADNLSTWLWQNREDTHAIPTLALSPDVVFEDVSRLHRLVEVRAQGMVRGLAMLALRPGDQDATTRYRLEFDLHPDEVDDGLLLLDLLTPSVLPAALEAGLMEAGLVGVCVARVELFAPDTPLVESLSTGRPRVQGAANTLAESRAFVLNPGSEGGPVEVEQHRLTAPVPTYGRRAMLRHPAAYLRSRRPPPPPSGPVEVEVHDLAGDVVVQQRLEPDGEGSVRFVVPSLSRPLFVTVTEHGDSGSATASRWRVQVRAGRGT
ncbi:MAG: hypothetical protein M3130_08760 [Actinomycetota bacterium]|nr:hypothetical protein [Actinomycetota bacterium]